MCLVPNGNLLVCDNGSNRVQVLTAPGEAPFAAVRSLADFAVTGARLPLGASKSMVTLASLQSADSAQLKPLPETIFLISFSTGAMIHNISYRSISQHCCDGMRSLRFTADGRFIVFLGTKACQWIDIEQGHRSSSSLLICFDKYMIQTRGSKEKK